PPPLQTRPHRRSPRRIRARRLAHPQPAPARSATRACRRLRYRRMIMCRNIRPLFNFDPPVTDQELRDASLQFVRKISGFHKPSKSNEQAFQAAVDEIASISGRLLRSLDTNAPRKNRQEEAA